jgi:DUF971 family protein
MAKPSPSEIEKIGDEAIRVVWDDGHSSVYANADLRFGCSCALCVEEWTGVRRVRREDIPPDIHATGLQLVGNYAMQLSWSDGHDTGIYTFEYLRSICPCSTCAQAAASGSST